MKFSYLPITFLFKMHMSYSCGQYYTITLCDDDGKETIRMTETEFRSASKDNWNEFLKNLREKQRSIVLYSLLNNRIEYDCKDNVIIFTLKRNEILYERESVIRVKVDSGWITAFGRLSVWRLNMRD